MNGKRKLSHRFVSIALLIAMLLTYFPLSTMAADPISTVADPQTLTRPETIYGDNTVNAGKITVGKSVSNEDITVNGQKITLDGKQNFLVTISQSAQVMGLTSESGVPVDVVFVLDTSGSMDDNGRAETMVTAANSAIKTLLEASDQNRVGVVAFSSEGDGGGTSNGAAASVLSSLAHYNDAAAENHLQWVNSSGTVSNNGGYIAGRDSVTVTTGSGFWQQTRTVNAYRNGTNGGTNIQAGIIAGAKMLTSATNTTYTDPNTGDTLTRIPFLIVLSDGQPTYTYDDETWYDPTLTGWNAAEEWGPGSGAYEGNGFLAAMTAAYYKGKITEHYYGENASSNNRCYVYTMGVELGSLSGDEKNLAQITLDPKTYTSGDYAAANAGSYWNYGNTANDNYKNASYGWKTAWESYAAGNSFSVRINGSGSTYTFTSDSIEDSRQYVSSIAYNDEYYDASDTSEMEKVFTEMVTTIQKKAISVPTKVTTGDHNFDGYITFTDPLGAYMEVKDMKGVLAGGYYYQGASFAEKLSKYGTADADPEFDRLILDVVKTRMHLTESNVDINDFVAKMKASPNQAYYNSPDDYDNSFLWWGNAYNSGEEDEQLQALGFAENDTVEYIESAKASGSIPAGADYVCRSYFFYGEAGGANPNPDQTYLYFTVRVQRELTAPYRETVVISAPASLLSMEKVLITETFDENGNSAYTAAVEHQQPARVVYEVGLWDNINPENVTYIVSEDYANTWVNGAGSVNYDPATKQYSFFTNDWDRTQSLGSHHRALAKATFDAAPDNPFYTYQEDTLLVDANGNPVTADPAGNTAYYVREYYEWSSDSGRDGTYSAAKKSKLIEVAVPSDAKLLEKDGKWYVPKGTYTSATLVVNGDDAMKDDLSTAAPDDGNLTGTSSIVAHPHRTGAADNSHYTVFLGNNGKLTLTADPYEPTKTVSMQRGNAPVITDYDGKLIRVGDILTYAVEVKNVLTETADITVSDNVPFGTELVAGSAGSGTVSAEKNSITWVLHDVPAGETRSVSFQVRVTEAAFNPQTVPGTVDNTATVKIGNTPAVTTNTTKNPLYGKSVTDGNNQITDGSGGFKVGDYLTYHIRVYNTESVAADITVTDKIPAGTVYVANSADNGGVYNANTGTITWTFDDMAPGTVKLLSFRVQITADAKTEENATQPAEGEIEIRNTAEIKIGENGPVITTNSTVNKVGKGDMTVSKTVADGGDKTKFFTINLTESTGLLDGTYVLEGSAIANVVSFDGGRGAVTVKHGETLKIKGLPAGVIISVEESPYPGWTPAYNTTSVTIVEGTAANVASVSIVNTYTPDDLPVTVTAKKTLKIYDPATGDYKDASVEAGKFRFQIKDASGKTVALGTNDANGNIVFNAFYLSAAMLEGAGSKDLTYTVSEIIPDLAKDPNMLYDAEEKTFTVTLGLHDGELTANGNSSGNVDLTGSVNFINYGNPASVTVIPEGEKTTANAPNGATFSFSVINVANGNEASAGVGEANGEITFSPLTYTQPGTYRYWIKESNAKNQTNGITYDTTVYLMQVVVSRNDKNRLVAAVTYYKSAGAKDSAVLADYTSAVGKPSFQNEYNASGYLNLTAGKDLQGRDLNAGEFAFKLIRQGTGNEIDGIVSANGTVTFATLYYSLADIPAGETSAVILYTMKEVVPAVAKLPGVHYDTHEYPVYVRITNDGSGSINAELVAPDGNGGYVSAGTVNSDGSVNTGVTFTNTYAPVHGDTVKFQVKKVLNGRPLRAGEFDFLLIHNGTVVDTAVNDADGTVTFIHDYSPSTGAGTYEYTVRESGGSLKGITYSGDSFTLRVKVTDDGNGSINAQIVDASGNPLPETNGTVDLTGSMVFTNVYKPANQVKVPVSAYKTLNGKTLKAGDFTFVLSGAGLLQTKTNDANGVVSFEDLLFTEAMMVENGVRLHEKTFVYTLSEESGNVSGMTYDAAVYTVTVTVTDDLKGNLTAAVSYTKNNTPVNVLWFVNDYTPPALTDISINGTKIVVDAQGNPLTDKGKYPLNGFEFELYAADGTLLNTVQSDGNGTISFPGLSVASAGEYRYLIKEKTTAKPGYSTDPTVWCVHVNVGYNGDTGLLFKIGETVHLAPENHDEIAVLANGAVEFANVYDPADADLLLKGKKVLDGRALREHEFTFCMVDENTKLLAAETRNHANGDVNFHLTYDKAGTYRYTVYESNTAPAGGITYSTEIYKVTVTVTDDGSGELTADVTSVTLQGDDVTDVIFHNVYQADPAEVTVTAQKYLDGKDLKADAYSFTLVNADNSAESYRARNQADGTVKFPTVTFANPGEYVYTLKEVQGSEAGVTYDGNVYTVTVVVTDDGNGQLHAATHYSSHAGDTEAEPVFHNAYNASSVDYVLKAKKVYEGGAMRPFRFVLSGEGFETQTKQNDDAGNITFDKLTFTKAGKYTFTLKETAETGVNDILFDSNVYTVVIEVSDDYQGQLKVKDVLVSSETGRTDLVFRNVHEDQIVKKDVFLNNDPAVSIDGKAVKQGDVLTYTITYKNYTGKTVSVTITDAIPAHTAYVDGSADNGGSFAEGKLTWNLTLNPEESKTVSFRVKVVDAGAPVSNQAVVLEGENQWKTNEVTTPVKTPDPVPDNPNTADNQHLALWAALMAVSGGVVLGTVVRRRKTSEEN